MRLPLIHSLQGKMLLYLALPVMLIIASILSYWYSTSLNQAVIQAKLNLSQTADTIAAKVNEETQLAVRTTEIMALAQQNGLFGDREASINFVRAVLKMTPSFVGASFGYEPNADNQDQAYINAPPLKEGVYVDQTGRFYLIGIVILMTLNVCYLSPWSIWNQVFIMREYVNSFYVMVIPRR